MLRFFEAEDCQYCQYMLRKILSQQQVQDWYNERFVSIAIDIHGDVEITDFDGITLPSKVFSDHRRIFLPPVVAFVNLDGAEIYRHLGMIGTPEEFLLLGEYGGLLPATFAIVFISALVDRDNTLREAFLLALAMMVIAVVVFWWALSLQLPLFQWGG